MRLSIRTLKWLSLFQPLFNFTAPKIVLIKDWRLGVLLRSLQVLVLLYAIYDLITKGAYLETQVPDGVVTPLGSFQSEARNLLFNKVNEPLNRTEHPYCFETKNYTFTWAETEYSNFECVFASPASLTMKGESEFFLATYFTLNKLFFVKPSSSGCREGDPGIVSNGSKLLVNSSDICVYENVRHLFPIEPENGTLVFLHTYSMLDKEGSLPETFIRVPGRKKEPVVHFPEGNFVGMPIKKWLSMAGVFLDKTLDEQEYPMKPNNQSDAWAILEGTNGYGDNGTFPMARLSGVELVLTLNYYQRRLARPPEFRKHAKHDVVCVIDIVPKFRWSLRGSDVRYMVNGPEDPYFMTPNSSTNGPQGEIVGTQVNFQRTGILFTFKRGGEIGSFTFRALVTALVTYSVMFSVAQAIVTFTALYALGLSSQLYKEFILESVEWRKEYARFAAQALVAGFAFMQYDKDRSWQLSRSEIFRILKQLLRNLPDDKIAALADFLIRHGDEDLESAYTHYTFDEENKPTTLYTTINISEWLDIFTEDKVRLDSLVRLIDNEYKNKKQREYLVKLATTPLKAQDELRQPLLSGETSDEKRVISHPVSMNK